MGRCAWAVSGTLLLLCGCAATKLSPPTAAEIRWHALCAHLTSSAVPDGHLFDDWAGRLAPGDSGALDKVAAQAGPALVQIRTTTKRATGTARSGGPTIQTAGRSGGTGVVIAADGAVLTSAHVLRDATEICVTLADGHVCAATGVTVHPVFDLAVLRIDARDLPALIPRRQPVAPGTAVMALATVEKDGGPDRRCGVVLTPSVSMQAQLDPSAALNYRDLIESTVALEPGFSGGPLLDCAGRLVGLNVAVTTRSQGGSRGYSLPLNDVTCQAIARLLAARPAPISALGVTGRSTSAIPQSELR